MSQFLSNEEFQTIYSRVPRLTVEIIVVTPEGVVVTKRELPTWHHMWHVPGVTLAYKEAVTDAVARVAREELGIAVTIESFLGYKEYWSEEKERGFGFAVGLDFICTTPDAIPTINAEGEAVMVVDRVPEVVVAEHVELIEKGLAWKQEHLV